MNTLTQGNWITMQCSKWGRVTFGKDSLKTIFLTDDRHLLKRLKQFCLDGKVKMNVDKTRSLFTFQIVSKRGAADSH